MKIKNFTTRNLFLCLFAILYLSVAAVSTFHAFHFFGLANNSVMAAMLAGTFEIGQAAVLFSLLTDSENRKKYMPWVLMCILTLVQVLGNVFSSYEYIITNSMDNLRYFKEPIFIWTNLPDEQANVIVTYIQGSLLPIVCLLLTSMVTSYLSKEEKSNILSVSNDSSSTENDDSNRESELQNKQIENSHLEDEQKNEDISKEDSIKEIETPLDLPNEQKIDSSLVENEKKDEDISKEELTEEEHIKQETPLDLSNEKKDEDISKEESIKQIKTPLDLPDEQKDEDISKEEPAKQIETPLDLQNEQHKSSKPSHFINL